MRGIYTPVTDIRRKVFTEVARMAYEVNELSDYEKLMRELPFKIIPGEEKSLRSSIFLERAIISERVRLAMGMSLRPLDESVPASEGLEHSVIADKYYEPPLINVIKFACNAWRTPARRSARSTPSASATARATLTRASASSAAAASTAALTAPSSRPSAPAPRPAAWVPSTPTSMAVPRSITISAFPAACAWSTARSALSLTRARSSS